MNGRCSHSVFFSVDKERTEELLRAIQRKTVTLDTLRYNPLPPCSSPAPTAGETHFRKYKHTHKCMLKISKTLSKELYKCIFRWLLISPSAVSIKRASVPRLSQPLPSLSTQTQASPTEWHVQILHGHPHPSTLGPSWKGWIRGAKQEAPGPPEQRCCFSPEKGAQYCAERTESALGAVHTRGLRSTLPPGRAAVHTQHAAEQRLATQLP